MSVRVRFAPSPTGLLHIGALRTVLFDHLYAKGQGGTNILRIEDTDRTRYNAASEQEFVDTLRWIGIEFNEGPHLGGPHAPYRQSERKEAGVYQPHIETLLATGHAYKAFETSEELDEMREYQKINKMPTGYFGGNWRDATAEKVAEAEAAGKPFVIRQRIPRGRVVECWDLIRGRIEVDCDLLPDPVLIKADGMPTYHFAAIVDDHLMGVTHVLRGEEWIPSFPLHWLLLESFGWDKPTFIHCPVIQGPDGKKLSKRHGATRVLDYGAEGFTPDAIKNFVALIGWSPGEDREVMGEEELIETFSLERIQPSPGKFDIEKLLWLNAHRIRQRTPEDLLDAILDYAANPYNRNYWANFDKEVLIPRKNPVAPEKMGAQLDAIIAAAEKDRSYVLAAVKEEQERVQTLADFAEALEFFLVDEPPMDEKAVNKWFKGDHVAALFDWILEKLAESRIETVEHYESILKGFQTHAGLEKLGPVVHPTRVALTGKTYGPGLFELMAVLGHDRIAQRIARAKASL